MRVRQAAVAAVGVQVYAEQQQAGDQAWLGRQAETLARQLVDLMVAELHRRELQVRSVAAGNSRLQLPELLWAGGPGRLAGADWAGR